MTPFRYSNSLHHGAMPQTGSLLTIRGAEVLALKPGEDPAQVILHLTGAAEEISVPTQPLDLLEQRQCDWSASPYRVLRLQPHQ